VARREDAGDALYGLPLEEFTSARKELADELRASGDRESADRVAALPKPTTAAWAVNQVMRTQRKDAHALLDAGERLRSAHEAAASGKSSVSDLRDAVDAERDAIGRLTRAARGLTNTQGRGLSENILERVTQTLHAVSVDDEVRSLAAAGRLTRDRQASDVGGFAIPAGKERPRRPQARRTAQVQKMRDRLERAVSEARGLRTKRTQAARAVSEGERSLNRARREMSEADSRVEAKEAEIEQLRRQLDQLK
jgi:hypothetical protein